ncbi:DUF3243 family protein [Selenihalanaerobacter shriftii]|uniref:DUF3243 domain-containing protein n=1 Tax=Selenihalanaerobacter shriftii TaxID=142842 RepID=A0A1T4JMS6_9FIRM|nr:DUF3243 family protein [Selenihalanaerobacter shriftii]SJZ31325.1 Protein of unknown function [Selenihalanaerobacter shriftii]
MSVLDSFSHFRKILSKQVNMAESVGMSDDSLTKITNRLADFLADNVEPRNKEEELLGEMWQVASEDEQMVLSKLILRLIEKSDKKH